MAMITSAVKSPVPTKRGPGSSARSDGKSSSHDPIERQLATMYSELLGVGDVGLHDDFFELGGHSLLAVRLLARIDREFKKAIPLPALFQSPTIAHLATFLRVERQIASQGTECNRAAQ